MTNDLNTVAITPEMVEEHGLTPEEYERAKRICGGREPSLPELGIFSVMWRSYRREVK